VIYDRLQHAAARQQLRLLGGVDAVLIKASETISPALVLIERDVQMPADNGLTVEKKTIASLLVAEVGKIIKGNRIEVGHSAYTVNDLLSDDGYVVRAFVRG
jgi:hypothetical protein